MKEQGSFFASVQNVTERFLSWRKCRIARIKEKQKAKNVVLDWIEAFFWAAGVVLLANQYLTQAYQIPSGSMIDTLLVGDRIFVNKLIYGPELLPGIAKLPSPIKAQREEVIIFENPEYQKKGPVFSIVQRVLYMLSFSFIDIDRDRVTGEPSPQFLIKRAAAVGGDCLRFIDGEAQIRFAGEDRWVDERQYKDQLGLNHNLTRLISPGSYPVIRSAARSLALAELSLAGQPRISGYLDPLVLEEVKLQTKQALYPHDPLLREKQQRMRMGWYISEARIFPLGDNRDNSLDARFFGAIPRDKVLGRAMFKYFPLKRLGGIH